MHLAARYARWAAAAAILLVLIAAGAYLNRAWRAAEEQRKVPPAVPPTVQQRSAEFTFSKVEKNQTLFTVRASRATEYKEANRSLLEDVSITIFGRNGERNDNIHTRQCNYLELTGRIVCQGEVQVDFQAPGGAPQSATPAIHLDTRDVSFERTTGIAATSQPVRFSFSGGEGRAIGLTYRTREGVIGLGHAVEFTLTRSSGPSTAAPPLFVTAGGLVYRPRENLVILDPPIRARQGGRELTAGYAEATVDSAFHPERATFSGEPAIVADEKSGRLDLRADRILASFGAASRLERLLAEGHVRANRAAAAALARDSLVADRADILFAGKNQPQTMRASGAVQMRSESSARSALLDTSELRVDFSPRAGARSSEISRAETLAAGTLVWKTPAEALRIEAAKLDAEFGPRGLVRQFHGTGGARIHRQSGSAPPIDSTSREFTMYFAGGEWSAINQQGEVVLHQGVRTANAARARFVRSSQTALLTGDAVVADAQSRTQADQIFFDQARDQMRAQGNVRTTYSSSAGANSVGLGQGPAYIVAPRLVAETKTGLAVYTGGARLWQGDAVVQADSVALNRQESELDARGHVAGTFLEASGRSGKGGPRLWHVRADRLLDRARENRAWLEGNASAVSADAQVAAPTIELFFDRAENGSQRLARSHAAGGVTLRQADRWATAALADYDAAGNKIVLSGGSPTLHDVAGNVVTGRQLTLFLASDTILVVSDEGARTLTKYRIVK